MAHGLFPIGTGECAQRMARRILQLPSVGVLVLAVMLGVGEGLVHNGDPNSSIGGTKEVSPVLPVGKVEGCGEESTVGGIGEGVGLGDRSCLEELHVAIGGEEAEGSFTSSGMSTARGGVATG